MTAHHIFRTDKPTTRGGPVLPMSDEDREFWALRRKDAPESCGKNIAPAIALAIAALVLCVGSMALGVLIGLAL